MRRTCRSHRASELAPSFAVGPGEAAYLVHGLITRSPGRACALLWLDHRSHLIELFAMDLGHDEIERIAEVMTACPPSSVHGVVVGSPLPTGPGQDEERRFLALRERFEEVGIDLLDWMVVGDELVWSLAELTWSERPWW